MNIKNNINLAIIMIITLLFISVGFSFAYFTANLSGGEDSTTITVTGGSMNIYYNSGSNINIANIIPSNDAVAIKTFTVTGNNTTGLNMGYQISLVVEENTFSEDALNYVLSSDNLGGNGTTVPDIETQTNIGTGAKNILLGQGNFTGPTDGNKVHSYTLSLYFSNQEYNQNIDQDKIFRGYILTENSDTESNQIEMPEYYTMATDDDFLFFQKPIWIYGEGDPYIDGYIDINLYIGDAEYVIIPEYINGTLITSTYVMFGYYWNSAEEKAYFSTPVKGIATLNNNITSMSYMFEGNESDALELTYLDTSNVVDMSNMFTNSRPSNLDLSSFDTSNVIDMNSMFSNSQATSIDFSSFDTSNVTDMSHMFDYSKAANLDLNIFDTSNVTDMSSMFYHSKASSIDISSWDTSSVTNMADMFLWITVSNLDLSTLDTSNVTNMSWMFYQSEFSTLDLSNFDTSKVTNMSHMFRKTSVPTLDLSSFDTIIVDNMDSMFYDATITTAYARTQADADRFNSSSDKPAGLTFVVK